MACFQTDFQGALQQISESSSFSNVILKRKLATSSPKLMDCLAFKVALMMLN